MRILALALALACAPGFAVHAAAPSPALTDSPFAAACADAVVESLGGRTWLLTDGFADSRLVARAKARGIDLLAMPLRGGDAAVVAAFEAAAAALGDPRLEAAAALGPAPFVLTWMQQWPEEAAAKLALMVEPSLAKAAGLEAVPAGLVYHLQMPDAIGSNALAQAYARHAAMRDVFGETPAEYAGRLRAERAWQLVRDTHMPVCEITEALGFESQSAFCRAFKSRFGATTTEVRRNPHAGPHPPHWRYMGVSRAA